MAKILLVEDDEAFAAVVSDWLGRPCPADRDSQRGREMDESDFTDNKGTLVFSS